MPCRISPEATETGMTLGVEGRLAGLCTDEPERMSTAILDGGRGLTLDLADVSFVDAIGVEVLRGLIGRKPYLRMAHQR
jgi:hypothetical protein